MEARRCEGKGGGPRAAAGLPPTNAGRGRKETPVLTQGGAEPGVSAPRLSVGPQPLRGGRRAALRKPAPSPAGPGAAPPPGAARPSGPAGAMGAGGLWARAAHTALSGGLALGLFLHRTGEAGPPRRPLNLQKQVERGELLQPLIFILLGLCSVLLYFKVSLMDPGFVKSEEEADKSEEQSMVTPQVPSNIKMRRCGYCMVKQPMRAKHCQLCQHCVRRYDHHCPWIENCVGEKNHPLFIVYLSAQLVVLLWGGHVAWSGLYFEQSWEWLQHNILLLMSFLMIVIFTIVVLLLLISHLYLISCNTTTWEFMSHHRISYLRHSELENPFDQGVILNLWRFFCSCHLTAWEKIYFHRNNEPV
uniref:Palmitoyltransferase n=1 Tax=Strix occidentalis caurina TaxID=311401 RepID=A0A8D0EZE1_STROC